MPLQHWIFLSPHFDDVALSCGGLVWHLSQHKHRVEVWTVMGGFPPEQTFSDFAEEMHRQWGMSAEEVVHIRRQEDRAACKLMGVKPRHFDWPDVIYRADDSGKPQVNNDEELFGKPPEERIVQEIAAIIQDEVPEETNLVLPMGLGQHIDHRAVAQAGEETGRVDFYYADYPYVLHAFTDPRFRAQTWSRIPLILDEQVLKTWQQAVLSYASQLSLFWRDEAECRLAIRNYLAGGGGSLWQKQEKSST